MHHTTDYFTPSEIAAILKVSTDTVIRQFEKRPGVLVIGSEEKLHKRRYRTLRIPRTALDRFISEVRVR